MASGGTIAHTAAFQQRLLALDKGEPLGGLRVRPVEPVVEPAKISVSAIGIRHAIPIHK